MFKWLFGDKERNVVLNMRMAAFNQAVQMSLARFNITQGKEIATSESIVHDSEVIYNWLNDGVVPPAKSDNRSGTVVPLHTLN